jgi:mRNA interferase MazF
MGMGVNRGDVYLVCLDPTLGSKIKKTRPCLVISPNEMNRHIKTVMVAPMTTKGRAYPSRIWCRFQGRDGQVVLDQLRTVDKARLVRSLGRISRKTMTGVLGLLQEMFAP